MTELAKLDETAAQPALPADPMVNMIQQALTNADVSAEKLTAFMDMRERQLNKEAEQAFNAAFAGAMADMPDIPRSGQNKHLRTRYSTLDDLIRTTRPVLARHGLSLNWQTAISANEVTVTAIVRHALGHQIADTQSGPKDTGKQMNALQGGGSTTTYLKRYTGFGILGLSSGDEVENDGAAVGQTITADQFIELQGMIESAGIAEQIVLDAERLESLETMLASKFAGVKSNLQTTIRKREAAQ